MTEREQPLSEVEIADLVGGFGHFLRATIDAENPEAWTRYIKRIGKEDQTGIIKSFWERGAENVTRQDIKRVFELLGPYYGFGTSIDDSKLIMSHLLNHLGGENDRILSLGTGIAPYEIYLSQKGVVRGEIISIGLAESIRKKSEALAKTTGVKNISFPKEDAEELEYYEEFDQVWDIGSLHWIPNWRGSLLRSCQALKNGGSTFLAIVLKSGIKIDPLTVVKLLAEKGINVSDYRKEPGYRGTPRAIIFGKKEEADNKLLIVTE